MAAHHGPPPLPPPPPPVGAGGVCCCSPPPPPPPSPAAATGWRRCRLLLQPAARAGSHPRLNLLALRLQNRGSEECDLLAQLETAQDFGVVKIADSHAD